MQNRGGTSVGACLVCLCLLAVTGRSRAQALAGVDIQDAADKLGARFEDIRKYGLGADALKAEYERVGFTYDTLSSSDIEDLLEPPNLNRENISTLFSSITDFESLVDPLVTLSNPTFNCCRVAAVDPSNPTSCCHGCESDPAPSSFTDPARVLKKAMAASTLPSTAEILFGDTTGRLLQFPAQTADSSSCQKLDARNQPWFIDSLRSRPREVVILVDLTNTSVSRDFLGLNTAAARSALLSLTSFDKAGVVLFSTTVATAFVNVNNGEKVVPVCNDNIAAMTQFINSLTHFGPPGQTVYLEAFSQAYSLFSNDASSDKILLFCTRGQLIFNAETGTFQPIIDQVATSNAQLSSSAVLSVYVTTTSYDSAVLNGIVAVDGRGEVAVLEPDEDVSFFYSPFINSSVLSNDVRFSRGVNSAGEPSLRMTRVVLSNSTLVGVIHAMLPWQYILDAPSSVLRATLEVRRSSYLFVAEGNGGQALYHPLLPSDGIQSGVYIGDLEAEFEAAADLDMLSNGSIEVSVSKQHLRETGNWNPNAIIPARVPSTLYCRSLRAGTDLYACLLVADEDVTVGRLNSISPLTIYESSRAPIRHDEASLNTPENMCNYFCQISAKGRVSFQLTGASRRPDNNDQQESQAETQYIIAGSGAPAWVQEGVSSEVAVGTSVTLSWLNASSSTDLYITRRHFATLTGSYLTYPPIDLNIDVQPARTEWFTLSQAHSSLITLTPPRRDGLLEGGVVVSAGYPLYAPPSESSPSLSQSGELVGVLAADITLTSLRLFVEQSLPYCVNGNGKCFIVDDLGNFIYHPDLLTLNYMTSSRPTFMADVSISSDPISRAIWPLVRELQSQGVMVKHQCVDHFSEDIRKRRFVSMNLSVTDTVMYSGNSINAQLRRIPGTNAFLVVLEPEQSTGAWLCSCNLNRDCFDCGELLTGCECPCTCAEDCVQERGISPCPKVSASVDFSPAKVVTSVKSALSLPPDCFNLNCSQRNRDTCYGVRECAWCEMEEKCVGISECCTVDQAGVCCDLSPQLERFLNLPICSLGQCFISVGRLTDPTSAPTTNTAAIAAGVTGSIVGLLLLGLLIVFIVWYQFFRTPDPEEQGSVGSAFDFGNKTHETVNRTALEADGDEKVSIGGENGAGVEEMKTVFLPDGKKKEETIL